MATSLNKRYNIFAIQINIQTAPPEFYELNKSGNAYGSMSINYQTHIRFVTMFYACVMLYRIASIKNVQV